MRTINVLLNLALLAALLLGACGPISLGIGSPPGGNDGGAGPAPVDATTGLYVLAGVAILIALLALFRK